MKSRDIRKTFLEFFESKGHAIVPSAPMVIKDDPTLMFTNAGMNQFKEYFLGNGTPVNTRVTDTQKCLRVSGKHNDLEEVGKDTYHHTMFEMLGNWSFGDYFKKEAITWAWELLTAVYGISREDLYVTIFEGSPEEDIPMDQEALDLWSAIVPEERIILGNKKDNFWEMGDQGPCGPSSEIHVDLRSSAEKELVSGRDLVNKDHPLVVEIWNLVFIQFNRKADGKLEKLPSRHVDTGMGFERLCMVLQGVKSNYDTDVFIPLITELEKITGQKYGQQEEQDIAIRVIADHVRAVTFAIADGQLPASTGAGYVIRRILRRAIRYGFTFLGQKNAFVHKLVKVLAQEMGAAFPELQAQQKLCINVIREEEQSFLRTLEQGLLLLDQIMENSVDGRIAGKKAFELYDTYGFPIDLTALIAGERGFLLDQDGFQEALEEQKKRSRSASKVTSGDWQVLRESQSEGFVGYDALQAEVKILRYRRTESKKEGERFQLVLDKTPFYPEGGGQKGDTGILEAADGPQIKVLDTRKENNLIIHITKQLPENTEGRLLARVDKKKRSLTAANHSATHLLHQGLRNILGTHVTQKGSMVSSDYLRFDFSHFGKLSPEEIQQVEDFVNERIMEGLPLIEQRNLSYQEAIDEGAIALFGEKYGDTVRAIRFGDSVELCGGTHVANTSDIWYLKILSEGGVASGVRRIEAITSEAARDYLTSQARSYERVGDLLKNPKDVIKAVTALQEENSDQKRQIEKLLREKAGNLKGELRSEIKEIDGINFLARKVELDSGGMKDLAFQLGDEVENLFLLLGSQQDRKAVLACYISKELTQSNHLHAGNIVKELGRYIQGGGGGQAFYATAGGKNPAGLDQALSQARKMLSENENSNGIQN